MDITALNSTKALRKHVLVWMCLFFGSVSLFFSVLNVFSGVFFLGFLELCFSVYCLYTIYHLNKHALRFWQSVVMCVLVCIIVLYANLISAPKYGLFVWSFALPVLCYLLMGKRYGIFFSGTVLVIQSLTLFSKYTGESIVNFNMAINLLLAYVSIWTVSHIFEGSRALSSKRLKNLALLDPLTGAGNRLSMNHYFEVELIDKTNTYLFLLDLDYFKQINDKFGHDVGDKVLTEIATLLRITLAKGYVFRVGGEEFAVIHSFDSKENALLAAEKLRATVEKTEFNIDGKKIKLTISVGVASHQVNSSLESIFIAADKQLYKAKRLGRNKVYAHSKEHKNSELIPA
ncbi:MULTISPECIES: GGDEF domain-containing protein [unclassified Pseudoalteromonas]|uniref:GGDEF domain-containing protein n=1 Tax=unclassified Pseudoalteromonas TaxID=194690 RepID=UPI0011087C2A|nr:MULTISPECIES: GGDEF domain-containing protein [unclassified Pseudoalteromonas]TMN83217.1 GGDEF domain-containing protein [Pseudoalteromonas sp. S410]TMN89939.1 GGDEF domain-containing protein [Pseudoalteromonas sp. S408]TMN96958.1 GGDEF domain-containing protein [Pseudoalteromonas sp. S409]TMN97069.1 GGDEF domain-containing protein [Pseudoalteromonas sp. S407]TMO06435.1 GGDEF domain-containing protein [Pseudoalteromonas sp. S186]